MEALFDILLDALTDAGKDTLLIVPFLFVTYWAMEWLEHKTPQKTIESVRKAGKAGPLVGALLGVLPQCGFSAAASTFYAGRVITLGTLFSVYLSTSDEMLPIFLGEGVSLPTILAVLGTKVLVGMVAGFVIDAIFRSRRGTDVELRIDDLCIAADCACDEHCAEEPDEHRSEGHDHADYHAHHEHGHGSIVKSALIHTINITLFVFLFSLVLNVVLLTVGEEVLSDFIASNAVVGVFASALVGLIPNCAASIAIAQLFVEGVLGSGAMIAGLLVAAGVGLLVLCRTNRHAKENVLIIVCLYGIGVAVGLLIEVFGIVF